MRKQFAMMIALVMIAAAGCKKDKANDPEDGGSNGKTKYISKVTSSTDGQQTVYNATYDGQNRLTAYNTQDGTEKVTFTYGANDALVKFETENEDGKEVFDVTYNASGVPLTGKHSIYDQTTKVYEEDLTYTVADGKVTQMEAKNADDEVTRYTVTYQNGNVTRIRMEASGIAVSIEGTYGTKKSAFAGINFKYLVSPVHLFQYYSKNELLTTTSKQGDQVLLRSAWTYTYDGDGYPLTSTSSNPDDPEETATTATYQYK